LIGGQKVPEMPTTEARISTSIVELTYNSTNIICTYESISDILILPHPNPPNIQHIIDELEVQEFYGMISISATAVFLLIYI